MRILAKDITYTRFLNYYFLLYDEKYITVSFISIVTPLLTHPTYSKYQALKKS